MFLMLNGNYFVANLIPGEDKTLASRLSWMMQK